MLLKCFNSYIASNGNDYTVAGKEGLVTRELHLLIDRNGGHIIVP